MNLSCFMLSSGRTEGKSIAVTGKADRPELRLMAPVLLNDQKLYALVDSGSDTTIIDSNLVQKLGLDVVSQTGMINLAGKGQSVSRSGYVIASLTIADKTFDKLRLEVMELSDTPLLIGLDYFSLFGFSVEGIPTKFPERCQEPIVVEAPDPDLEEGTDPKSFVDAQWQERDRLPPDEVKIIMDGIAAALEANQKVTVAERCTHPAAVIPLDTGSAGPVYRSQYPIPQQLEPVVTEKVLEWWRNGTTTRAPHSAAWNSPLLAVRKRDVAGNYTKHRICLDPRAINLLIPDLELAIPKIADLFKKLHGFVVASSLDLEEGYHQFSILEKDRIKTTFTWKGVRYMFVGAPFGFKPITQLFQSCMEQILEPCIVFVVIFVDDILVFSGSVAEHVEHLISVIELLTSVKLRLKLPKCHFAYERLKVLGHLLSGVERTVDPKKLSTLATIPAPETGKQIMSFLGFVNYLRDYIPNYAAIAAPLEPLRSCKRIGTKWSAGCQEAFERFRQVLSEAPVLEFPSDGHIFHVSTDASQNGVGAVLYQEYDDAKHYISFVSTSLSKSQRNYSATRRELLSIIFALKRLYYYLYGTHFKLYTDHKSLTFLLTQKHTNYMMLQWMDTIMSFSFEVIHCPGITHVLPDALSRLYHFEPESNPEIHVFGLGEGDGSCSQLAYSESSSSCSVPKSISEFAYSLSTYHANLNTPDGYSDAEVKHCLKVTIDELVKYPDNVLRKFVDERLSKKCPPESQRQELLSQQHLAGHFGAEATYRKLWELGYYWPEMRAQCVKLVANCDQCLRFNVAREGFHLMQSVFARYPFEHIALDLAIMNPVSERGHSAVAVVVDIATRMVLLEPLADKSAKTIAWFLLTRIFSVFGPPKIIQSDNGSEFVNHVLHALNQLLKITHQRSAPYNPRANGAAERFVGTVKKAIYKVSEGEKRNFDLHLPMIQYAMNIKQSPLTGCAPLSLVMAKPVIDFADYSEVESKLLSPEERTQMIRRIITLVFPELWKRVKKSQAKTRKRTDAKRKIAKYVPLGSSVMILDPERSSKSEPKYIGPYTVASKEKGGVFRLLDSSQALLKRKVPISQMKLISAKDEKAETFIVERILKHRGPEGARQYLVKWLGYPAAQNTWEPASNFEDLAMITKYWNSKAKK